MLTSQPANPIVNARDAIVKIFLKFRETPYLLINYNEASFNWMRTQQKGQGVRVYLRKVNKVAAIRMFKKDLSKHG